MTARSQLLLGAAFVASLIVGLYVAVRRPDDVVVAMPGVRVAPVADAPHPIAVAVAVPSPPADAPGEDPDRAAARADREAVIGSVWSSGEAHEVWETQAKDLVQAIARDGITSDEVRCFVAGCAATLTFPSEASYRRAIADLEKLDRYIAWTGGKKLSRPEIDPAGHVIVALALFRPD